MKRMMMVAVAAVAIAANAKSANELFKGARWIEQPKELNAAAPRFTTTFKVERDGPAEIAICGLGQYVATLNGKPIGRGDEFNLPGWTRSTKTCFYNVFTPALKAGVVNTLEITLGNGMYNVPQPGKGLYTKFVGSEGEKKLIVGGVVKSSVEGWKVSQSEVVRTHVYSGDDIDHRVVVGGRGATALPVCAEAPKGELREATFVCRLQEVHKPVRTMRVSDDELTVDFGQNAAYVPTVVAKGPHGSRVEIEFSEIPLRPGETRITKKPGGYHGTVARCAFTLAGTGDESFTPPFFYYGFRYMKVRLFAAGGGALGDRALPELVSASARVVMGDAPRAGTFECSIKLLNQIHDICWWAQRSNMQSVFTDCPHREKLGWQEQDHIHADQIRWGWNADAMFAKTCMDLADSQLADGMVPDIAPEYTVFRGGFRHSIEWGSSLIQVPWQQYEWTGDTSLIRDYWKNMVAYHKYIRAQSQNEKRGKFITPGGLGDWYQQTVSAEKRPLRRTSIDFTATAFYYLNAATLAKCADILGKKDEAAAFREEAANIKKAFNAKWWNPQGHYYENNSQTANSMAIAFGLADPAETAAIVSNIVEDVRGRGAVGTGEIGYPYLLKVLAENGQSDVIFEMTADTTKPGYGYMVAKGNTSCHEAWDCREGSSFNHFMMADIVNWFYGSLGGIKRTAPGFKTFTVAPEFLPGLDWVKVSHAVPGGDIRVAWRRVDGGIEVKVSVPKGTTATVHLPGLPDSLQDSGEETYVVPCEDAPKGVSPSREYVNNDFRAPAGEAKEKVPGFVWLEAENFADYGGWVVDTQFTHKMGSAYLLAPVVLEPVAPASAKVTIPRAGTWRVWVRTKDWLPEFSPGKFAVEVAGKRSGTLGASRREGWMWEKAGDFALNAGACEVELLDFTGALTRCDALLFTTDLSYVPPEEPKALAAERQRLTGDGDKIADGGAFDLVVVGAGPGGLGAALAAARNGLRVALVHDRPVLGGNSSCEMQVTLNGAGRKGRESGLVCEAKMRRFTHAGWSYSDAYRQMTDELKGWLFEFPNERVMSAEKKGDAMIAAVVSRNTLTGAQTRFRGRYFADGTGDGWLGIFAGAAYMHGREARDEYDEAPAPEKRDELTMSGCVMKDGLVGYRHAYADHPVKYETPAWADVLPKGFTRRMHGLRGAWWMENNGRFNDLEDPERARDQLVRISFAYWGWLKNESPLKDQAKNAYMAEIAWKNARREGFRLVGDYVMTANDALKGTMFPDRISYGGWSLDTHDPLGMENPTGNGYWRNHPHVPIYSIPYRCIYSKNISNLFLCGRSISATHIALGTIRVQSTLFQLGQAAGTAAAIAAKHGITPRACGERHIKELQQQLLKDDQYIPHLANEDPLDLARTAKVSASDFEPRHVRFDASDPGLRRADKLAHKCAGFRRAVRFERGDSRRLDTVLLNLQNTGKKPVELTAKVYLTDDAAWRPKGEPAAVLKAIVPDGRDGLVRFFNPTKPIALNARFVWVELVPAPGIAWYLREGTTGHSDLRAYCGVDNGKWTPVGGEEYSFVTEPALERDIGSSAVAVTDGMARSEDGVYHGWISDSSKELPQWVRLDFPSAVSVSEVRIAFDPDFATIRASARPRSLVKSYVVEGLVDGKWVRLGGDSANQLRHRVHHFLPISLDALRVTVNETWGDPSARIFEIRAYGN